MDVRHAQQLAQAFGGLQVQEACARQSGAARLQRGPFRSLAAENEPQPRFAFQAAGHVGQDLQALLAAHVAGIQRHDRVGGDAELRGTRRRPGPA